MPCRLRISLGLAPLSDKRAQPKPVSACGIAQAAGTTPRIHCMQLVSVATLHSVMHRHSMLCASPHHVSRGCSSVQKCCARRVFPDTHDVMLLWTLLCDAGCCQAQRGAAQRCRVSSQGCRVSADAVELGIMQLLWIQLFID